MTINGGGVALLKRFVHLLLLDQKQIAQQLPAHPDQVDGHSVGRDTVLSQQQIPCGHQIARAVFDGSVFLAQGGVGARQRGRKVAWCDVEHTVIEQFPGFTCGLARIARMAVGQFVDHLLVGLVVVPRLLQDVFIGELLHVETLKRRSDAHQIVATLLQGSLDALSRFLDAALHVGVAAEVAQVAPDEWLAVEALVLAPHLLVLAVIVQHGHLALGHAREHGAGALLGVVLTLVVEEPCHLQPLGIGIDGGKTLVDVPRDLVEVVWLKTGRIHLVKRVDAVDVVSAEQTCLLLEEHTLDAAVERILAIEEIGAVSLVKASPGGERLDVGLGKQVAQRSRYMTGKGG